MKYYLLQDVSLPSIGIGTIVVFLWGIIVYLGKRAVDSNEKEKEEIKKRIDVLEVKRQEDKDEVHDKINEVNIAILKEIREMSIKLAEYKGSVK